MRETYSFALTIFQRVLQMIPSIWAVLTIGFILVNVAPGDPVSYLLDGTGDPELAAQIRSRLGLDAPLHVRYTTYLSGVLQGQLGRSYVYNRPVLRMIFERMPATLILFFTQFVLSTVLGIMAGALAAFKRNSWWDKTVITMSVVWYSIPTFWSGQLLLLFLAVRLDLFPAFGMSNIVAPEEGLTHFFDLIWHLVLPSLTLALLNMALVARISRSSMVETLQADFIITARSKGLSESIVFIRHALHNALLPIVTVLGLTLGQTMSGAVMVETVFSWPGLGRLMYDSILHRDYPVTLGLFIVISVSVILANLLTDMLYVILDPRVRLR
jgi:peptide/nickel transport system permease protein